MTGEFGSESLSKLLCEYERHPAFDIHDITLWSGPEGVLNERKKHGKSQ